LVCYYAHYRVSRINFDISNIPSSWLEWITTRKHLLFYTHSYRRDSLKKLVLSACIISIGFRKFENVWFRLKMKPFSKVLSWIFLLIWRQDFRKDTSLLFECIWILQYINNWVRLRSSNI
jgi:hypothetical protein